ncbi:hypothetical protein ACFX2J_034600 [Malus domestica]
MWFPRILGEEKGNWNRVLQLCDEFAQCSKTALKLAILQTKLLKNKKDAQVKQMRRELAQSLETGQNRDARIRVRL